MGPIQKRKTGKVGNTIKEVSPGSIAEEVGIEPGDKLISIDGIAVKDVLDYYILASDQELKLIIEKQTGVKWHIEIEKDFDEKIGIEFCIPTISQMKRCNNQCIFCFIDQLPKGMRKSLYEKDDDYRLSPIFGNYVTLTNLSEEDLTRLIAYKVSPLYISVHSTNEKNRQRMLNNSKAGNILETIERLYHAGIEMHGQIVLCPGYNDGEDLSNTIYDLVKYYPYFKSLAVVPVGLTRHRKRKNHLTPVAHDQARRIIEQVGKIQNELLYKLDTRFVFLADEFFIKADYQFPPVEWYEDFLQLENGVGLVRLFEKELTSRLIETQANLNVFKGTFITGTYGAVALNFILNHIKQKFGVRTGALNFDILPIKNDFFGHQVTVAGLVTGTDIIYQVNQHSQLKQPLLIPDVMLKDQNEAFLDNVSLQEITSKTTMDVRKVPTSGGKLVDYFNSAKFSPRG